MIDLSGNPASIHKNIPKEKLFDMETIEQFKIKEVVWHMSIKPGIRDVKPYYYNRIRLEEIEVFSVRLQCMIESRGYRCLMKQIHSKVMYPSLVFFEYNDKYKLSAWKIVDSSRCTDKEILKSHFVSSWIYNLPSSDRTRQCINSIVDILFNGKGYINDLYDRICQTIYNCPSQYIGSRQHLLTILYDMSGIKSDPIAKRIECSKYSQVFNPHEKYKKRRYDNLFKYCYEYEDIWHVLINDDRFKRIIENRRYRSVEDMILQIDSKYGLY